VFNRSSTKDVFDQLLDQEVRNGNSEPTDSIADPVAADAADEVELTEALTADPEEPEDPDEAELAEALDDADDPESADAPAKPRSRRVLRRVFAAAAVLVFAAAVGLAGFFGWQLKQQSDTTAAGRAALDVARTYAVTLTSVDYQKIDENTAQVLDGATGEFKDMYSESVAQLRQLLIDNKAVSHGVVVDAAIKSASKSTVEMLVFVDQSISNAVNPDPRIDRSRVAITMQKVDGRWLASKVDIK